MVAQITWRKITRVAGLCGLICTGSLGTGMNSFASPACAVPPKGLKNSIGSHNIDARQVSFTESGQQYDLSIYSGYAPQSKVAGTPFCVRYEAVNDSKGNILSFFWPDAGMGTSNIVAGEKNMLSYVKTVGSSRPQLSETKLHAFKSTNLTSKAYVADRALPSLSAAVHMASDHKNGPKPILLAQQLADDAEYPDVGASFSVGDASIDVVSGLSEDTDGLTISVQLSRNGADTVGAIQAPFLQALTEASNVDDLVAMTAKFQGQEFSMKDNSFTAVSRFPASSERFLIEQPVKFVHGEIETCFMVPMYSPVEIISNSSSCK